MVSEDGTPQGTVPLLVYRKLQPPSAKHDSPERLPVVIVIHPTGEPGAVAPPFTPPQPLRSSSLDTVGAKKKARPRVCI